MGMFGMGAKLPLSFDPQNSQPIDSGMGQMAQMAGPQDVKLHAFDKGGKGWQALGIIGDGLQVAGGGQATYAPYMQSLEDRVLAERQRLAQLQAQHEYALQMEAYKRANPEPTTEEKNANFGARMTEEQRLGLARLEDTAHPITLTPQDGGVFRAPRIMPQPSSAAGSIPRPAGASDDMLLAQAQARLQRDPSQFNAVMEQLKAWGVGGQ